MTMTSISTLSLLAVVAGLLYHCYRRLLCTPVPGIPYNKNAGYTLLGDVPEMIREATKRKAVFPWMAEITTKHNSPIAQVFLRPFSKPWIVVSDYKETQDVLLRRTKEFDRSPATIEVFHGVVPGFLMNLMSDDEEFKYHKMLLRDLMTPQFLHQVAAPHIYDSVTNLVELWSIKARLAKEHPTNVYDDVFHVLLDSITVVAFGLELEKGILAARVQHLADSPKYTVPEAADEPVEFTVPPLPDTFESLMTLTNAVTGVVQSPVPTLHFWVMSKLPYYRKAYKTKEDMINAELEKGLQRIKQGNLTEKCALDNVLQREWQAAKKANREPNYKSRAISDELFGFLIAGEDTTSSTMCWAWKFLSADQRVQQKLRSSLFAAFPDALKHERNPTAEEILKSTIPYLDATIEEIHRQAAIFPMTIRRALVDTVVLGHRIPKGYDVAFTGIGPSYQKPAFDIPDSMRSEACLSAKHETTSWDPSDIEDFKPERWLKKDEDGNQVFDAMSGPLLAFSLGPRGCYGRRLAYMQMRILVVLILWNLDLLEVDGELGSMVGIERISKVPVYTYLRLREVQK